MGDINQNEFISINFKTGLGIFDNHYGYPVLDVGEKYNGPAERVRRLKTNIPQYGPYLNTKPD